MDKDSIKQNTKPLHSVDNMNRTLHITRRWAWLVLIALLVITLALLLSIFYIKVPTHISTQAFTEGDTLVSFVDVAYVDELDIGQHVLVDRDLDGSISSISHAVFSSEEAVEQVDSNYAKYILGIPDWSVRVDIAYEGELDNEAVHPIVITTGEVSLSTFFVGGGK